jgi:hypothetical protein
MAFVDGHVAERIMKGFGRIATPPRMPPECDDGRCDCILIRGLGWQLDTLPGHLIDTWKRSFGTSDIFDVVPLEPSADPVRPAAPDTQTPAGGLRIVP